MERSKHQLRDYFAEMYVAGKMADAGWNIYFPRRDKGFDLIAMIGSGSSTILRPVQVKGLYPTEGKTAKQVYGFVGKLSAVHSEMILALVYFPTQMSDAPSHIAWMPNWRVTCTQKGHRCQPAQYTESGPRPRREFVGFFGQAGLDAAAEPSFSNAVSRS